MPHRNALYRNRGGWKFEDVSARPGVDAAAWGNGVCAGDVDNDGRLDLYVTNWGANLLFRNRGDGTFEEIAARPASPPAAGAPAARSSTPTPTAISISTSRATSRPRGNRGRAQRTLTLAQRTAHHGRPDGPARRVRPLLREPRRRTFSEAAAAHGLADPRAPTASASSPPTTTTTASSICSSPTTRIRISCIAIGRRPLRERRPRGRRRGERRSARAGRDGRRCRRLRRRRPDRPRADRVRARSNTLYRNLDGRQFEDVTVARDSRRARSCGWAGARRSSTPTSTASSISSSPTATSSATSTRFHSSGRVSRRRTSCCSTRRTLPRRLGHVGRRAAVRAGQPRARGRRPRQRRRSGSRRQQHGRDADGAREPSADRPPLGGVSRRAPGPQPIRHRRDGDRRRRRRARSPRDPVGRQLPVAERSAAALRPGRLHRAPHVEVRMPGGARWRWQGLAGRSAARPRGVGDQSR